MSSDRSRVGALSHAASVVLLSVACGGAEKTPYYDAVPQQSGATTGGQPNGLAMGGASSALGGFTSTNGATGGDLIGPSAGTSTASTGGVEPTNTGGAGSTPAAGGSTAGSDTIGNAGAAATSDGSGGAAGESTSPSVDCSGHGVTAQGFDGHCYRYSDAAKTFDQAVAACKDAGAHLVTISSENRSVAEFLAENAFVWRLAGENQVWIDATDGKGVRQPGDGTYFKWLTGEPMMLDNWSSGQPNNSSSSCQTDIPCSCDRGSCYEHCGFLWDTPGHHMNSVPGWNDRVCDHQIGFVCEWE